MRAGAGISATGVAEVWTASAGAAGTSTVTRTGVGRGLGAGDASATASRKASTDDHSIVPRWMRAPPSVVSTMPGRGMPPPAP